MNTLTVGVVLITHNAKNHLQKCLPPLIQSPLKPRILLINSSSNDGTVELAKEFGVETHVIERHTFNHGLTRELARKKLGTDIVVMTTPDAYAKDPFVLDLLIKPLINGDASFSYARQIPHLQAGVFEAFPRFFNYQNQSQIRSIDDVKKYGVYTFFFSDSFGAYLNSALDDVGGFSEVLTGEDTLVTAKLLQKGYKVAYVADALVHHSHNYTLKQEFKRHFDTGLARATYQEAIKIGGADSKRGLEYVKGLLNHLLEKNQIHLIPYAIVQSFVKWVGYQIGFKSKNAPKFLKKALSSQDFYWK